MNSGFPTKACIVFARSFFREHLSFSFQRDYLSDTILSSSSITCHWQMALLVCIASSVAEFNFGHSKHHTPLSANYPLLEFHQASNTFDRCAYIAHFVTLPAESRHSPQSPFLSIPIWYPGLLRLERSDLVAIYTETLDPCGGLFKSALSPTVPPFTSTIIVCAHPDVETRTLCSNNDRLLRGRVGGPLALVLSFFTVVFARPVNTTT